MQEIINAFLLKYSCISIIGPTGTGKSELACMLKDKLDVEIVSVDSVSVYRGLNIGSAKPSKEILKNYPHHLIDILDINDSYNVANFYDDVSALIEQIKRRNKIPLLVGGAMMYFYTLKRGGLNVMPQSEERMNDEALNIIEQKGLSELYNQITKADPSIKDNIKPFDTQRIIRQWQVLKLTGKTLHNLHSTIHEKKSPDPMSIFWIINKPHKRQMLDDVLYKRAQSMMDNGFIDEVENIFQKYINSGGDMNILPHGLRSVGYKEVWKSLIAKIKGKNIDKERLVKDIYISTRQLAKRQTTWLNKFICDSDDFSSSRTYILDCFLENKADTVIKEIEKSLQAHPG